MCWVFGKAHDPPPHKLHVLLMVCEVFAKLPKQCGTIEGIWLKRKMMWHAEPEAGYGIGKAETFVYSEQAKS